VTDRIGAAPSAAQQQTTKCDPDRSSHRAGVSWRNEDGHDAGGGGSMNRQVPRTQVVEAILAPTVSFEHSFASSHVKLLARRSKRR
jgi:hypothetical protein